LISEMNGDIFNKYRKDLKHQALKGNIFFIFRMEIKKRLKYKNSLFLLCSYIFVKAVQMFILVFKEL
jgi:hypothetical protein